MRALIQRVLLSEVRIRNNIHSSAGGGLLVFLGISHEDAEKQADLLIDKIIKLRIFEDENGKMNRSAADTGGDIMVVSQFTLYADTKNGNRPSFTDAAPPGRAEELYDYFLENLRRGHAGRTSSGVFGENMQIHLVNDGPVTILLEV